MKNLGMDNGKPYIIPAEAPKDASEQLKKTQKKIDLKKDNINIRRSNSSTK